MNENSGGGKSSYGHDGEEVDGLGGLVMMGTRMLIHKADART